MQVGKANQQSNSKLNDVVAPMIFSLPPLSFVLLLSILFYHQGTLF
jgi:hypothetical protein